MILTGALETPQLWLRSLDDQAATGPYLTWMQDPDILRFLEARFSQHTPDSLTGFIKSMNQNPDALLLGMFLKDDGRHVGNIKLGPVSREHLRGDIGLLIGDKSVWGRGLATEAITALTRYGFDSLNLNRLYAGCYGGNEGSVRAFVKAGWQVEGRLPRYWRLEDGHWADHILLGCLNPTT
ncbi:GNAT family N-acetyltransferase [Elstera cyanobacteriorum]|uniref:GNAT family N-acetyltransferase n=1 Tax=Elstera cyanobacteriorum TaxID=2022747 RepID=UPI002357CC7C|nr:GNAT family N-acetyltransferase [Elstera cyanobacteriorum]MCK6442381.1 GNAT family N-acetyltransferase [Elstera cyanobacteriorum]